MLKLSDIRKLFIDFFVLNGHTEVQSSSLIPTNDKTLLFTNAGMNQFKNVFLGTEVLPYKRAVSSQKCVRAGGKHNDLENVGYTARHHTFFEMLGNFSFGDYFKDDAINYAWIFLTKKLLIPAEKLYVTIYHTDEESYILWNKIIDDKRIIKIGHNADGTSDNFWQMGDTGPCGPCTEIFYDHGSDVDGGLPCSGVDGDRYIEIWNCVFMEFNRRDTGELVQLPNKCVDTGMGLERITAVMQSVHSNYETDVFTALIEDAKIKTKTENATMSLNVLADHIRASVFLIADGVVPYRDGRGYVLRRIIRRAVRHGYKLVMRKPFFYKLADKVKTLMPEYKELSDIENIKKIIYTEEEQFFTTLIHGINLLENELMNLQPSVLDGEIAFKLYDTFGFPLDLTEDICREKNITVDIKVFEKCLTEQKLRSGNMFKQCFIENIDETMFCDCHQARVLQIYDIQYNKFDELKTGNAIIVLNQTCFYPESGGQIGDIGTLFINDISFVVTDTKYIAPKIIGHIGHLESGVIKNNDLINLQIDSSKRQKTACNHSATHLLHKALRMILGEDVSQKGSLVTDKMTRFDFSHNKPLSQAEINSLELLVNQWIVENHMTNTEESAYQKAIDAGAVAMFSEKYSDTVRVITMGNSKELCGGTHVNRTGDIGVFVIKNETGVSAGVRRIEAITSVIAIDYIQKNREILQNISQLTNSQIEKIDSKINSLYSEKSTINRQLTDSDRLIASLILEKHSIKSDENINFMIVRLDKNTRANIASHIIEQLSNTDVMVFVCYSVDDNHYINIGVGKQIQNICSAKEIATLLGKGGGNNADAKCAVCKSLTDDEIINIIKTYQQYKFNHVKQ